MTKARLLEFVREPGALFWVFIFPILVAVGLGIAFRSKPPERARIAIEVRDLGNMSAAEQRARAALEGSAEIEVSILTPEVAAEQLRRAKVDLVVVLASTSTSATGDGLPSLVYELDPTQPQSQTARLLADAVLETAFGRRDVLAKRSDVLKAPGERYIDFLVPALIGVNLMSSSMWGIGWNVVVTRTRKLMKRFAATPMRRSHYLLSFILSRFAFLLFEVIALLIFARLTFDVRVRGSYWELGVLAMLGALSFAGLALLVAARPRSVEAAGGWMNFVMMPMWFLSGTFFSYERFPEWMQPILRGLPLTALNDALRGVINDGRSITELGLEIGVLVVWGLLSFVIALRVFRWQ